MGKHYDDWVCALCNNYNYSFRLLCNRCHLQTKTRNGEPVERPFPNFVFLSVSLEPWEGSFDADLNEPFVIEFI